VSARAPLAILALVGVACRSTGAAEHGHPHPHPHPLPVVAPTASSASVAEPDASAPTVAEHPRDELPPLEGSPIETWHSGGVDVVASLPVGAHEPRPVIVGVHGSGDRPEAAWARWRRTVAAWAFVVCPKGVPWRGRLAWGSPAVLAERIDGALAALRDRYRAYVAEGPVVYAGWSLGATLGPKAVALRPSAFDPVLLVEIGHTRLDATASVAALRTGKATHAVMACATRRCATFAKRLIHAGESGRPALAVAFVDAGIGRGHVFDDRMARAIRATVAETVKGDACWNGFAAALAAAPVGATDAFRRGMTS
jgi:hypothetical protein